MIISNILNIREVEVNIPNVEEVDKEVAEVEAKAHHKIIIIIYLQSINTPIIIKMTTPMTPIMNTNIVMAISQNSLGVGVAVQEEDVEAAAEETVAEGGFEVAAVEAAVEAEAEADFSSMNIQKLKQKRNCNRRNPKARKT